MSAGYSIGTVVDPVLILTGPPCAGKTTTARLLAARFTRAVHLESDAFFHFIASGHVAPWQPRNRGGAGTTVGGSLARGVEVGAHRQSEPATGIRFARPGLDGASISAVGPRSCAP